MRKSFNTWRVAAGAITVALVAAVAVAGFGAAPGASADSATSCGNASDPLQITGFDVPQPLATGQLASATISGTLSERLSMVKASFTLTKDGAQVLSRSAYLPVYAGPGATTITAPIYLPTGVPAGAYEVKVSAATLTGAPVGCTQLAITVTDNVA